MRESTLEQHFARGVRALGGLTYKLAPTHVGMPDRLVLMPGGRTFLVELKTETGRLRPAQKVWHERAAELGHHVAVLYGRDQVDAWLAELDDLVTHRCPPE